MAYETLKSDIQGYVRQNGEGAITGDGLQSILLEIVNTLGTGYKYVGVATPSTSPGTPTETVFYIGGAGTYANFGTTVNVAQGQIAVFKYNNGWSADTLITVVGEGGVSTSMIAASAVTNAKINDGAVGTSKLGANAVTTAKIADNAVETAKIKDSNVTTSKIADSNVTTAKVADKAITKDKIADSVNSDLDWAVASNSYYRNSQAGDVAAKVITTYKDINLIGGGSLKVTFEQANTADDATLNIDGKGAKPLYYNGVRVSSTNSWAAGETVEIYYNNYNSGIFYAKKWQTDVVSVSQNTETGKTELLIGDMPALIVDNEPEELSNNLVKSGGVYKDLYGASSYVPVTLTLQEGKYYSTGSGATIINDTPSDRADTNCCVINCNAGQKFKIYGEGTSYIKLYAFTSGASNTILETNSGSVDYRDEGLVITAPEGTRKLFINFYDYDSTKDKLERYVKVDGGIEGRVSSLESSTVKTSDIINDLSTGGSVKVLSAEQGKALNIQINGDISYSPITLTMTTGAYHGTKQSGTYMNPDTTAREGTSCAVMDVTYYQRFKVFGKSTSAIRIFAFTDSSNKILSSVTGQQNYRETGLELFAPYGATKLYINFLDYNSSTDKLDAGTIITKGINQRLDEIDSEAQYTVKQSDIVNDLTSGGKTKVLSAEQGKLLSIEINGDISEQVVTGIVEDTYYVMNAENGRIANRYDVPAGSTWSCASLVTECSEGDVFKVYGFGKTSAIRLYAFTDNSNNIVEKSDYPLNTRIDGIYITCPSGASKVFFNFYNYDDTVDKVLSYVATSEGVNQKLEKITSDVNNLQILKGKKILSFGDSITEFKWTLSSGGDGKGWVDHTAEILGCEFVNVAVGGSHMGAKYKVEVFDEEHEYSIDDFVFRKPADTMNIYRCIAPHSGAWDDNDFLDESSNQTVMSGVAYIPMYVYSMIKAFCDTTTADVNERFKNQIASAECVYTWKSSHDDNRAQVQRLMTVDPEYISLIIIAEGTNDYAEFNNRGESGSHDATTCLGAINESIRLLNSTYKNIPVFYVTPPVKWIDYEDGSGDVDKFSDNYKRLPNDITFREWVYVLMNEYRLNHIPVCNLYDELQWTMYNFSNYFPNNDGTHPRPGFKNIGAKVASFLLAHNVIK